MPNTNGRMFLIVKRRESYSVTTLDGRVVQSRLTLEEANALLATLPTPAARRVED